METKQPKPFHRACTFGRFNLFHKGHLALIEEMTRLAPSITIGLSDNDKNLDFDLRKEVIAIALLNSGLNAITSYNIVRASQPFELFEKIKRNSVDNDTCTVFGDDQFMLGQAAERHYDWTPSYVRRLTSSTALRVHLDREEWDLLTDLTVPGTLPHLINLRKLELNKSHA